MSLSNNIIQTSINVAAQPSSISLSPDGHWLLVAHYGNNTIGSPTNALTLIDLTSANARADLRAGQSAAGRGVRPRQQGAGGDHAEFILFDPSVGTTQVLQTIAQVATNAIPQPPASFPGKSCRPRSRRPATARPSPDSAATARICCSATTSRITPSRGSFYISSPPAGPRVVSLSDDGCSPPSPGGCRTRTSLPPRNFRLLPALLNIGSSADRFLAQSDLCADPGFAPPTAEPPPILGIFDSDNLTLRKQIQLPENLAGKACWPTITTPCIRSPTAA